MHPLRVLSLLLLAPLARAEEKDIGKLLASKEPRERAWGAYHAAERKTKGFQPRLEQLLGDPSFRVRAAAFDALIRTKAAVDWKWLEAHWKRDRDAVTILLALHPKKHQHTMLALLKAERLHRQYLRTFRNNLTALKTPGFAAHLMKDLPLTLNIAVRDPKQFVIGLGGGAGGAFSGRGHPGKPPPNWPPLMRYEVTSSPTRTPLSAGRYLTFYRRYTRSHRTVRPQWSGPNERFEYIAELARAKMPVKRLNYLTLIDDMAPFLVAQAADARAKIEKAYRNTLALLQKNGAMTAEEAKRLKPKLTVFVSDQREDKSTPLPKLD